MEWFKRGMTVSAVRFFRRARGSGALPGFLAAVLLAGCAVDQFIPSDIKVTGNHVQRMDAAKTADDAFVIYLDYLATGGRGNDKLSGSSACKLRDGAEALQIGRLADAAAFFTRHAESSQNTCAYQAKTLLAETLSRQGRSSEALNAFAAAEPGIINTFSYLAPYSKDGSASRAYSLMVAWFYRTYARELERSGDAAGALQRYRSAVRMGDEPSNRDLARMEAAVAEAKRVAIQKRLEPIDAMARTGDQRGALDRYLAQLNETTADSAAEDEVLQRIIALVQNLTPPPAVPEDFQRHALRGQAAIKLAKSSNDYSQAVEEFRRAARLAPWVADIHYNLGIVQEQAGELEAAMTSFRRYLLAAPDAPDRATIQSRIYELEFAVDQRDEKRGGKP